jgi:hypothetical protein
MRKEGTVLLMQIRFLGDNWDPASTPHRTSRFLATITNGTGIECSSSVICLNCCLGPRDNVFEYLCRFGEKGWWCGGRMADCSIAANLVMREYRELDEKMQ